MTDCAVAARTDDATLVIEALHLQERGQGYRSIANSIGRSRHWVRHQLMQQKLNSTSAAAETIAPAPINISDLEFHPLANLFPLIEGAAFDDLVADILANGQREDIVLLDGMVLDGRNRYRACLAAGITPRVVVFRTELHGEPLAFVVSKNLKRRHLNDDQRRVVAAKIANLGRGRPDENAADCGISRADAARLVNVDEAGTERARTVIAKGTPAVVRAVERGKLSVSQAAQAVRLVPEQQDRIAEAAEAGCPKATRTVIEMDRRAAHAIRSFGGGTVDDLQRLAASGFRAGAILADPPWKFITRSEGGEGRSANQHYRTGALDRIKALPVAQLAAPDAVLFIWMVDWCPAAALEVIAAWGFNHKTTAFTWAKQNAGGEGWHMGQGYWTRANPETCWLATRGNPRRLYADVRQLIVAPVMEHSRKPDEVHDRIKRLVEGDYLELYARRPRQGWVTWGDELPFEAPPITSAISRDPSQHAA